MTDRRRPAAASRILAAGLSTAATLGLTAGMAVAGGAPAPPDAEVPGPQDAARAAPAIPRRVVVLVRRHQAPEPAAAPPAGRSTVTAAAPSAPGPAARPAPRRPRPTTRSRGS